MSQTNSGSVALKDTELSADSITYIEGMYERYLESPTLVSPEWQHYFQQFPQGDQPHSNIQEQFLLLARNQTRAKPLEQATIATQHERRQVSVLQLIAAYRNRGHQKASLDPLGLQKRQDVPDLHLSAHGLSLSDRDTVFQTGNLRIGKEEATLGEIVDSLEAIYCGSIGAEYMHIVESAEKRWIQERLEGARGLPRFSKDQKISILERLTAAEGLEKYLGNKYVGAKRFGLEGGESLIPMMNEIIQRSGAAGTLEIVIGMAHRGRLNVLVNTLGKNPAQLFGEFEGKEITKKGSGDVKYHQGFSTNVMTPGGEIHLAMAFNPSHLEIVSPVVEGSVRARQRRRNDLFGHKVLPISIHGDAAFAGQGVVMETFQMSQTRGYGVGGTIHIVINNQVGFTTSEQEDARSTEYCTDIAKMVQCPIFHVNGDDPEAVIFVTQLAVDFRLAFKKDVVIDLFCYRRRGHNEADEPSATQPVMYQRIQSLPSTRVLYADQLVAEHTITREQADVMVETYRQALEEGKHVTLSLVGAPNTKLFVDWTPYIGHPLQDDWATGVAKETLVTLGRRMLDLPNGFAVQRQVEKTLQDRAAMWQGDMPLNWGAAEVMAYATLIHEDYLVRLTGQDVCRGTFSHRHAVLIDQHTGNEYCYLKPLSQSPSSEFTIFNSLLSEEAVLAFEYGYATTIPKSLIIWEAQFGDFANGAQVVIDQFISSGETKWERVCGLTLLLPHGFEGQGPEHSSARLERFLQLCAEENMQVATPTTPAQIFHLLRRQAVRPLRKPLIVMSPKSLLRHKLATSTLDELVSGQFNTVIDDAQVQQVTSITRLVLCSGKVYYDLLEKKQENSLQHIALVRIEQLYPFPKAKLSQIVQRYPNLTEMIWCQEEPKNQGAWFFVLPYLAEMASEIYPKLLGRIAYAGRIAAAAPAVGSPYKHAKQQAKLVSDALGLPHSSGDRE